MAELTVWDRRALCQQRDPAKIKTELRRISEYNGPGRRLGRLLGESQRAVRQQLDL